MRIAYFIVPGSLEAATGGTVYDRRIVAGLREIGWSIRVRELEGDFPAAAASVAAQAEAVIVAIPDRALVVVDGLALATLSPVLARHGSRLRFVALVHMPIAAAPQFDMVELSALAKGEARALAYAARVVVTGPGSGTLVAQESRVPAERIRLVEPGTDAAPIAAGSAGPDVHLVCVATVNAIKGHDLLVRALDRLRHLRWRLSCAGSLSRDPETVRCVELLIAERHLANRVQLLGELGSAQIADLLHRADLFVLATRFETYGMAVAEALARGLPVVAARTGAIPSLVGDAAGVLVPPGDESALADALQVVIADSEERGRLHEGALRTRSRLQPWSAAVEQFAAVLMEVMDRA